MSDWEHHLKNLNAAAELPINYDPKSYLDSADHLGWAIDHHRGHLGFEEPGEPTENGIFQRAAQFISDYKFPDPKLIEGFFDPASPLLGRTIVLEAHFLFFNFHFANRVNEITDQYTTNEVGNRTKVWGYSYQTLQGHLEEGQMSFEIWKDTVSGEISFHIDAYSKVAKIRNPLLRFGFFIMKRPLQRRYVRSAIERTQELFSQDSATPK